MGRLKLGAGGAVLVIISAGDNALHYAITARPWRASRIANIRSLRSHHPIRYTVDMNLW